jgi:hypothetical protein
MSVLAMGCLAIAIGAPLLGGLLETPLMVILCEQPNASADIDSVLSPLAWISGLFLLVIGISGTLIAIRERLARLSPAANRRGTWGCGYAAPTQRLQYSGSSFVWTLAQSFRQLLRSRRDVIRPEGSFAADGRLSTQTLDAAVQSGYRPAFLAITRACERLWPLQHGRIQLYLMYIVATLLLVFTVEAWFSPFSNAGILKEPTASSIIARQAGEMPGNPRGGNGNP